MNIRLLVASAVAIAVTVTAADAQTIVRDNTTPIPVESVNPYQTDFNAISGMQVSWTLSSGSGSATWGALGGGLYGVSTTDFRLWSTGTNDTFGNKWNLWAQNLVSFSLNALLGNAVFDIVPTDPFNSTPNSASGMVFDWNPNVSNTTVTYSNPVGVAPNNPIYDLYGQLNVSFGQQQIESCLSGWTLTNSQCKQLASIDCNSGYSYQSSGTYAGECTKFKNTTCPSGWSPVNSGAHQGECSKFFSGSTHYQAATVNYFTQNPSYTYSYQPPIITYQPILFGTSTKCDDTKAYNYSHSGIDNSKCFGQFYQDMDQITMLDDVSTPQDVAPEPVTITLLATGLAGVVGTRRRRRK